MVAIPVKSRGDNPGRKDAGRGDTGSHPTQKEGRVDNRSFSGDYPNPTERSTVQQGSAGSGEGGIQSNPSDFDAFANAQDYDGSDGGDYAANRGGVEDSGAYPMEIKAPIEAPYGQDAQVVDLKDKFGSFIADGYESAGKSGEQEAPGLPDGEQYPDPKGDPWQR